MKETRKERTGRAALRGRPARSEGVFCAQALRQRVPGAFRVTARRARGREHGGAMKAKRKVGSAQHAGLEGRGHRQDSGFDAKGNGELLEGPEQSRDAISQLEGYSQVPPR